MVDVGESRSAFSETAGSADEQVLRGKLPGGWLTRFSQADQWLIWVLIGATMLNGLLSILSILLVRFSENPRFLSAPLPFGLYHWSRSLTLVYGFLLFYLSFHLYHRRRTAWWVALIGTLISILAHIGRGGVWYALAAQVVTVLLLLFVYQRFTVRSEIRNILQGSGLALASLIIALAYGTAGFWLLDKKDFGLEFNLIDSLTRTIRQYLLIGNTDLVIGTRHARWFLDSLNVMGVMGGALAVYSLFRPVAYRLRTLPLQKAAMKTLLEQYGGTTEDFFKLWPEKSYFFSESGQAAVAFKVVGSVALCLGDPVGSAEEMENVLGSFLVYCRDNGWQAAFHQVKPTFLDLYRRLGLQDIKIGEEAIIDLDTFTNQTFPHSRHLRHTCNQIEKNGYQFVRELPVQSSERLEKLEEVSKEWLQIPGRHERSFSLGYFDRHYLEECPLDMVLDPTGRVVAFANEVPSYKKGEVTIDLMRHRLDVPNGVMAFLFVQLMKELKQQGFTSFDLGLAPYAGVGDEPDASLQERAIHQIVEHLTRFFSYKGMRDYKAKFEPNWEDRYMVYQGGPIGLAKTGLALVQLTERVR